MEYEKNGLEEAVGLGGAAVSIAFDVASGNYARAGVTGVIVFGKYVLVVLAGILLIVTLIVNMIPIIIGDMLGFSSSTEYVKEASNYDRQKIKENMKQYFFDEESERRKLAEFLAPLYEEMVLQKKSVYQAEPLYAEYLHEVSLLENTFLEEEFEDWLSGVVIHEADAALLQRIKMYDGTNGAEEDALFAAVIELLTVSEDIYLDIEVLIEEPVAHTMLMLFGADATNAGGTILLDSVSMEDLTEDEIEEYIKRGYVRKEETQPGTITYVMIPEEVSDVATNREYILIMSQEDMDLAVSLLKIVGAGGDLKQEIFQRISWLSITEEPGNGSMGISTSIITATKDDVMDDWEGISDVRVAICDLAISCVGNMEYVWGGFATGPGLSGIGKGLDCSHFIDWVFWTVTGDNLGNSSTMGMGKYMEEISFDELLPGDLAFTKPPGTKSTKNDANHVLIFVGKNASGESIFVDARSTRSGVCMSTYPEAVYYYRPHCIANY